MWDDRAVFRALWQRISRLFGGSKGEDRRAPGHIPAPETLVAKVQNVKGKDRDILRVAQEAVRRGHPDQAVIAYWKAVQVYLKDGQILKAVSALKMILQHSPHDLEAFTALADAYEALDRKRDAANTCLWMADIFARQGQRPDALAVLYRAMDLDPMVRGARERIQALGGELPASARGPSKPGPPLRLQSKMASPTQERPFSQTAPVMPVAIEEDPQEMPGESVVVSSPLPPEDDDKIELDIEGDDAVDFPDDSLVLPVTEAKAIVPVEPEPEHDPDADSMVDGLELPESEADEGAATIAMAALSEGAEMMSEDLDDATVLSMEAPPWDGPTDEHAARWPEDVETDPRAAPAPRRFGIPAASTTVDINPPSAMVGSEHDPAPKVGVPGQSTRAYSVEELKNLGLKVPEE